MGAKVIFNVECCLILFCFGLNTIDADLNATLLDIFGTPPPSPNHMNTNNFDADDDTTLPHPAELNQMIMNHFGPPASPEDGRKRTFIDGRKCYKSEKGWQCQGRNKNNYGEPESVMSSIHRYNNHEESYDPAVNEQIKKMFPPNQSVIVNKIKYHPAEDKKFEEDTSEFEEYEDISDSDFRFQGKRTILRKFTNFTPEETTMIAKEQKDATIKPTTTKLTTKMGDTMTNVSSNAIKPIYIETPRKENNDTKRPIKFRKLLVAPTKNPVITTSETNQGPYKDPRAQSPSDTPIHPYIHEVSSDRSANGKSSPSGTPIHSYIQEVPSDRSANGESSSPGTPIHSYIQEVPSDVSANGESSRSGTPIHSEIQEVSSDRSANESSLTLLFIIMLFFFYMYS